MNQNTPFQPRKTSPFGLVGWLKQTRVQLPLKGVECRFHVCGDLLDVELDQIFHQNHAQPLDCVYTFPLPAGAAVYRCEMHVNGRVLRARVEEHGRAREIAREQKAAGRRTALVEMERENLFTLTLGNLQPGDLVVIRFGYFETLTRLADWTSLRIPFCPGVRYIPGQPLLRALKGKGVIDDTDQVPDASRLSPPRIEALHPDAASLLVEGVIENPPGALRDLSSPSHPVVVHDGADRSRVRLAERGTVPDCDFALRWTEVPEADTRSVGWMVREGADTYALVRLCAPRPAASATAAPQDFYFLVDRSGSMEGLKWQQAVRSFRAFLGHLGPEDRAWATFFSDSWRDYSEKPMAGTELAADGGLASLEALGVEGGTELLPALRHVLDVVGRHSPGRPASIILITDGQVGNESAVLEALRAHPGVRVHAFGIDTAVNDALLVRLAGQQQGSSCMLQPTDDIVGAVTRLGSRLRNPVLTALRVGDGWELPAGSLPDLHADESLSVPLKIHSADATEVAIRATCALSPAGEGQGQGEGTGRETTICCPLVEQHGAAIRLLWAGQRIRHLLKQGQQAEALGLAKQHNLLCEGAAFIAWDEAQQVAIADQEIVQPNLTVRHRVARGAKWLKEPEEFASLLCAMDPNVGSTKQPGPFRRDGLYAVSPAQVGQAELDQLLSRRPRDVRAVFQGRTAVRIGDWYARIRETFAFGLWANLNPLVEAILEWVIDGSGDASSRVDAIEELIHELEWHAPAPESGLTLTRNWVTKVLPDTDSSHRRILALLDDLAKDLARIRERERAEGRKILVN